MHGTAGPLRDSQRMDASSPVLVDVADRVATIILNNPDERNTLTAPMVAASAMPAMIGATRSAASSTRTSARGSASMSSRAVRERPRRSSRLITVLV